MAEEKNINEGPSCACGKADLYEEWLKNENKKEAASKTASSNDSEDSSDSENKEG